MHIVQTKLLDPNGEKAAFLLLLNGPQHGGEASHLPSAAGGQEGSHSQLTSPPSSLPECLLLTASPAAGCDGVLGAHKTSATNVSGQMHQPMHDSL